MSAYPPPCPWCGAKAGRPCEDSRGDRFTSGYQHEERVKVTRQYDLARLREKVVNGG